MADTDTHPIAVAELPSLFGGLNAYAQVFLAVSGGADSTALMHLVSRWLRLPRGEGDGQRPAVAVLSVDHGLRPQAADEAAAVVVQAESLGFPAHVLTWTGTKPESGVQDAARTARYDLMTRHIREAVVDPSDAVLVTAHHRDDTAETLLMRLARGSGVDGLASIPAHGIWQDVALLRPLLDVPKSRLSATLVAVGASWTEDPSNQEGQFERVQLREAAAARAELGLDDVALSLTARRMARARRALEVMTEAWLAPWLEAPALRQAGIFVWPAGGSGEPQDEIAVRALTRLLPVIGGVKQPPRLLRVERLWDDMQRSDFPGATLGNCIIRRNKRGGFNIFREPERGGLPEIDTQPGTAMIWDNRFEIKTSSKLKVRAFRPGDIEALDGDRRVEEPPYPLDALRATPVVADADGVLTIPALNLRRGGERVSPPDQWRCRFLWERLIGSETGRARQVENGT